MSDGIDDQPVQCTQEEEPNDAQINEILTSEQQDALKQAFDDIDLDHSNTISKSELRAALQLIGQNPTPEEMHKYMAGTTEEGHFTREEFFKFIEDHIPLKTQDQIVKELIDAFEIFDEDRDTYISKKEFRKVMTKIGDEPLTESEADDLMDRLDTIDKDGQLCILELGKLFIG